ncbi:MAG TPA: type VI secretion system-associated protein TagF [Burkholderiaceae bacterium]|nr:type VI secretion system-associated protein TagF [Burkholderiaceae bacterium]
MSRTPSPVTLAYFGKLPTRGDFVRSAGHAALTQSLDRWLTQGMELLAADPRWKLHYDRVAPLHFAFLGTQGRVGLAGQLTASQDASGRRFPFVMAGMFDVPQPAPGVLIHAPSALARLWTRLEQLSRQACQPDGDAAALLADLAQCTLDADMQPGAHAAPFANFLGLHTVGGLEAQLRQAGHGLSLRRAVLAVGLLLQPVLTHGATRFERGLVLPIPGDPLYRSLTCTWWLSLVVPFLRRHDFEVSVFVRGVPLPQLVVGFNGASPRTFRALMSDELGREDLVDITDAEWVDELLDGSYGLRKLSSHLQQPELPLQLALDGFLEAFLGQ